MSFKSIDEVQRLVDRIGPEEFAKQRAFGDFSAADMRMIEAWDRHCAATDAVARAEREERAAKAAEASASAARDSATAAHDSARLAKWAIFVSIAALVVAVWELIFR